MGFQSGIKEEKSLKMLWNNFKVAFAMYSKIPMPMADWNKENMKYTFCFFPFIGLVIGALSYLVGWAGGKFGFNPSFVSAVLVLVPVVVTGGFPCRCICGYYSLCFFSDMVWSLQSVVDGQAGTFDHGSRIYGFQMFVRNQCHDVSKGT